jgi:predicted DNA-binding ribbon-helix-helix protein
MRDKHYKVRHIRLDDPVWEELKKRRLRSKLSWNQFIKQLLKDDGNNKTYI